MIGVFRRKLKAVLPTTCPASIKAVTSSSSSVDEVKVRSCCGDDADDDDDDADDELTVFAALT